jgi:predicted protein tyrosine phosphatase
MNWVDEFIAIGDIIDSNRVDLLRNENVDLIIDVRTAFKFRVSILNDPDFIFEQWPEKGRLERIVDLLVELSNLKARVLIHCVEGVDRTPFVAMLYLAKKRGIDYKQAYDFVKLIRPQTVQHLEWLDVMT